MSSNKKIFLLRTIHVVPFKTLTEVLSNVLTETIWVFSKSNSNNDSNNSNNNNTDSITKPDDFYGLEIATADSSRTIYIKVALDGKQFDEYYCKYDKLPLGISLEKLYKLLKSVDKDDILSMYVEENDRQNLIMEIENQDKKSKTIYKLKLMDLDQQLKKNIKLDYDVCITMQSGEFHRLCREMSNIAEYVEIICTKDAVRFKCDGDYAERKTVYKSEEGGINIKLEPNTKNKITQGIYELKNIVLFTKCSNLCTDIEIYMKNDFALTIKYTVATLGKITIALSPIPAENVKLSNKDNDSNTD